MLIWEVMSDMAALLELKDFHYSYGNIKVIKGINMKVEEGEMVCLIGANGAGKSTTMNAISGLIPAKGIKGEIIFNGQNIAGMPAHKIAALNLGQVLENRHIFAKLTVTENLIVGAFLRKNQAEIREDIKRIFKRFPRLEERRDQLGGTLSGGEQQMLAIARSLVGRPKLLMLDEPSLGLAPLIVKEVFDEIRAIHKEGTTVLFVEQNSRIALNTAERAYVFQTGEIVMEGKCEDLIQDENIKSAYLGKSK
jgi:branched-chain amino acid transport system ATP-binding protein